MNGRPITRRQIVQLMIALTLLAWATQTLFHQWGYGQEVSAEQQQAQSGDEKFVPGTPRFAAGATLELRGEATIVGDEVRLRNVCRWSKENASVFEPIADLVLIRIGKNAPFRSVSVTQIKNTLSDAGVNMAALKFSGATACTVSRSDGELDEATALQQWIDAHNQKAEQVASPTTLPTNSTKNAANDVIPASIVTVAEAKLAATQPAVVDANDDVSDVKQACTLRERLVIDLSERLGIQKDLLQVSFDSKDDKVLNLSEPFFQFELMPVRVRDLGGENWDVVIRTDDGLQKVSIAATARAWQTQAVITKAISAKQIIRDEDLIDRRTLIERLPAETILTREQIVGQQAGRELKSGMVVTARMVDAVPLVRIGQFVTITLQQGGIQIRTVARAMEAGTFGQSIKVKNEATKEVFQVVMVGPQTAVMNGDPVQSPPPGGSNVASVPGN